MKILLLAASLLAVPAAASAQAAPPAKDVYDMSCSAFHRNSDGSWNAVQPMTLKPADGPIPLKPTFRFKPGTLFSGFDLAAELDRSCPH